MTIRQQIVDNIIRNHVHYLCMDVKNWQAYRADFTGMNLSGLYFDGANLTDAIFDNANCAGCSFKAAIMMNCRFKGTSFNGSNLSDANMTGSEFRYTWFKKATCKNTNFSNSSFERCLFEKTNLLNSIFRYGIMNVVSFVGSFLKNTTFEKCVFQGKIDFSFAYIEGINVDGTIDICEYAKFNKTVIGKNNNGLIKINKLSEFKKYVNRHRFGKFIEKLFAVRNFGIRDTVVMAAA